MTKDIVSNALNQMMNAKRAGKSSILVHAHSKLLLSVLAIARLKGYVKSCKVEGNDLKIEIGNIHGCRTIKPRFYVSAEGLEKYVKRYLPAKDIGLIIISTNNGLMTHHTALEKNKGGSLIAYFY